MGKKRQLPPVEHEAATCPQNQIEIVNNKSILWQNPGY